MADTDLEDDDQLDELDQQAEAPATFRGLPVAKRDVPAPAAPAPSQGALPTSTAPINAPGPAGYTPPAAASTPDTTPDTQPAALPREKAPPSFAPPKGKTAKFDPSTASYDPDAGGAYEPVAPEKDTTKDQKLTWSDYGNAVWSGVLGMGEDLANAGKFVADKIGASPETQAFIERQRKSMADAAQSAIEDMSPRAQDAMHASIMGYLPGRFGLDAQGNKIPTPGEVGWGAWLGMSAASLMPSVVMAVVPGSIAGKATVGVLSKLGAAEKVAGAIRTGAEMATTGSLFGAQNAGQVYGEIVKQIGDASDKELMADPTYAANRQSGMSVDDAKRGMIDRAGNAVGMAAGVGAVAGAGVGGLLTRGAAGAGAGGIIRRGLTGAAEGAAAMGGQAGANTAIEAQAQGKPVDWNAVLAAAAAQGLPGAALGAGGGILHGREEPRKVTESDVKSDPAQGAAGDATTQAGLETALTPEGKPPPGAEAAAAGSEAHQPQSTPPEAQPTLTPDGPTHIAETTPPSGAAISGQPAPEAAVPEGTVPAAPEQAGTGAPAPAGGEGTPTPPAVGGTPTMEEAFKPPPETPAAPVQTPAPVQGAEPGARPVEQPAVPEAQVQPEAQAQPEAEGPFIGAAEAKAEAQPTPESKSGPDISPVAETPVEGGGAKVATTAPTKEEIAAEVKAGVAKAEGEKAKAAETPTQPTATQKAIAASKAKRAAQKAAMGKPGERVRGEGAVAETAPVTAEEARAPGREAEVEEARVNAVQNLRDAVAKHIEVKPGADVRPLVNRMLRDLSERVGRTDGSNDAVAEMLHLWRDGPEKEFPGLAISRKALAERIMRDVTGHDPNRLEVARARAEEEGRKGAEVRRAPSSEAIEETAQAAPETAEGEREGTEGPTEKARPKSTDAQKIGNDLLERVLSGEITPEQAHAEYGARRKEGQRTFREFVESRIKHAEDTANERKILEDIAKLEQNKTLSANARRNKLEALKAQLERTGSEHAAELRERVLSQLEDPVGAHVADAEAARQEKLAALRNKSKARTAELEAAKGTQTERQMRAPAPAVSGDASRFIRIANDPRSIKPIIDFWKNHIRTGERMTVRSLTRFVRNNPELRERFRPYHQLLGIIDKWLPNTEIFSPPEAHAHGLLSDAELHEYETGQIAGQFSRIAGDHPAGDYMVLSHTVPSMETFVHESMHAITTRYINHLLRTDPDGREITALKAIWVELREALDEDKMTGFFHPELDRDKLYNLEYALTNPRELHTMLMTSPDLWHYASGRMASDDLRLTMQQLGYPPMTAKTSIWAGFRNWVRKALGIETPKSASEVTMLDHFLAPAQKITENAARWNDKYLPRDPLLHSMGAPVMDTSARMLSPGASRVAGDMLERADVGRWGDRIRRFFLPNATSDAIVDRYHELLPSLGAWREASQSIDATGKTFADKFSDRVKTITNRWNKLDNPNRLGQLQVDATIAKAHLGDDVKPGANDHLTTAAQKAELAKLQQRYQNLTPAERALYKDMRDIHGEMYQHLRDAQMTGLVRGIIPDATQSLIDKFKEAATSKDGLNKFVEESNLIPAEAKKLARGVADVYSQGYVQGDYFPLRRYGDYVVRVGNRADPENYSVEFFDSHAKAVARRAELLAQKVEGVHQVARKSTSPIHDLAPNNPSVDELYNTMSAAGMKNAEAVRDMLKGVLLEHATHSEAARTRMRRRGVKGADINQARILNDEFLNNTARVGYAEHGLERTRALNDMENEVDQHELPGARSGDAIKARAVYDEMQKRSASVDPDNVVQSLLSKANRFSFAHALMSPSHMLTSSMEAHTNSLALLGARHGIRAGFALTRALAEMSPLMKTGVMNTINAVRGELEANDWNLLHVMRDRAIKKNPGGAAGLRKLFDAMDKSGAVDHTQLQDIRQSANPTGAARTVAGKVWNRFFDMNAASAHAVDVMNKTAIAKAAYDLELRRTKGDTDAAVKYAMDTMRKAMPNYARYNAPRIATARGILGPLGAPLMQFKRYGLHMYSVLANLARDMARGENKWEATKAFAGVLATHAMMAGTLTWIADPLRYIGGAYDLLTGRAPHNYQNDVRSWMAETFGKEAGEVLARGLPHALGFDVHNRVGLANLLEIPGLKTFDKQGIAEMLFGAATGAPGEAATDAIDGAIKLMHGDIGGFMTGLIPRPLRDLWKAGNLATSGVPSAVGGPGLPTSKLGTRDIIYQGLGFQPSTVTEYREGRAADRERQMELQSAHTDLTNRWLTATGPERQNVQREIDQFNADPTHKGYTIKRDQLLKDLHARAKQQKEGPFGLRVGKKQLGSVVGAGAFANVP